MKRKYWALFKNNVNIMICWTSAGEPLAIVCGETIPPPIYTSDSFGYVKFTSDNQDNARGFSMKFEASIEGRCLI